MKFTKSLLAGLAFLVLAGGMMALPAREAAAASTVQTPVIHHLTLTVENASKYTATVYYDGHLVGSVDPRKPNSSWTSKDFVFPQDKSHSLKVYVNGRLIMDHPFQFSGASHHVTCFINASTH